MQEIDLPAGYDENILTFKGYSLITENNDVKQRTGIYIRNGINYIRRSELEGQNNGLIIIDVQLKSCFRIIGLYRVFNPPGIITQHAYFTAQLQLIRQAAEQRGNRRLVILGDFNLNEEMKFNNKSMIKLTK